MFLRLTNPPPLPPKYQRGNQRGFTNVYFMQALKGGLVKIGAAKNVKHRLSNLQCGSPVRLDLVGLIERVPPAYERYLHDLFKSQRRHGEWFDAEVLSFLNGAEQVHEIPTNSQQRIDQLMTQRQALKFIREETGLSYEATASLVRSMPTRRDGKREKVFHSDVIAAVTDALRPSEIATVKPMRPMRPIKQSQRDRVDLSKLKRRDEWPSIAI